MELNISRNGDGVTEFREERIKQQGSTTLTIDVMSRSGVLGYQSGRGLLLFGLALAAPAGGTFSLLLKCVRTRQASGLTAPFATKAPGDATLLLIKKPPAELLASAGLLAVLS